MLHGLLADNVDTTFTVSQKKTVKIVFIRTSSNFHQLW